ncbi:MAG: PilZ domain-containing protein [bacterium]
MIIPSLEKRSCSRFTINNARVCFKKAGIFSFLRFFSKSYCLVNISKAGLSFNYKKKMKRGAKIILKLYIPKMKPLYLIGRVRWQKKICGSLHVNIGVEFVPFADRIGHNKLDALAKLKNLEALYSKK